MSKVIGQKYILVYAKMPLWAQSNTHDGPAVLKEWMFLDIGCVAWLGELTWESSLLSRSVREEEEGGVAAACLSIAAAAAAASC